MDFLAQIATRNLMAFVLILFVGQLVAFEIGLRSGRRRAARGGVPAEGVGVVVGGMLGLLAFVLALTLSSSTTRFQERRQTMLTEANAIGSAWSRTQAIGDARAPEIARQLKQYAQVRTEFVAAPQDTAVLAGIELRGAALQADIWQAAAAIARAQPNPLTVSLLNALDQAFGAATAVRFAFSARMLPQLFWLLLGMTALSVAGMGYQLGVRAQTLRRLSLLIIVMWTAVIADILDLGTARIGWIGNDESVYHWATEGFEAGMSALPASAP